MSKESIRALLTAQGTFPGEPEVRANFEALFEMAASGQESPVNLAWGFREALDQWSHVDALVDPSHAERLRTWAMACWDAESYALCDALGALLVNAASPSTLAFLNDQRVTATDPDLQRLLDKLIAAHAEPS